MQAKDDGFVVAVGADSPLPDDMPRDAEAFLTEVTQRFPHAANEIGLFRRCAGALPDVLRGNEDPLSLLFGDAEPTAGDLYRLAPVWRAANRMLGEVVRTLVDALPDGRQLRVLEVGAGIGSATDRILPELPAGRFDYVYTDISAGFFADAEARFSADAPSIDYRVLDIEKDPMDQGFEPHAHDLVIAANVLHATRYLDETLAHCRSLLAPSGLLVALENQRGRGWMDLIFGQLDGWWRYADRYRANHALAGPDVWCRALADTGFAQAEVLGIDPSGAAGLPDRGVIVAQGPAKIDLPEGAWILAADRGGMAAALATQLADRNQRVVLAGDDPELTKAAAEREMAIVAATVEMEQRESWRSLVEGLPPDVPLAGVVHLVAQDGAGADTRPTAEMAMDTKRAAASALALVQGIADADAVPEKGPVVRHPGRAGAGTGTDRAIGRGLTMGPWARWWRGRRPNCSRRCSISTRRPRHRKTCSRMRCCLPTPRVMSRIARAAGRWPGWCGRLPARPRLALPEDRGLGARLRTTAEAIETLRVQSLRATCPGTERGARHGRSLRAQLPGCVPGHGPGRGRRRRSARSSVDESSRPART